MLRFSSLVAGVALALTMVPSASAQYLSPLVEFDGDPIGSPALSQEMFRVPEWSGSTTQFIVANPPDSYAANAAYRDDAQPIVDPASLWVYFEWEDETDPAAWMRLSTYNADVWPNPSIHLAGKVRFKLVNEGDWFDGQFGICLGVRETGEPVPQLEDGGTFGDIEWVGVTGTEGEGDDIRPVPAYVVPVNAAHILVEFDLATGHIWVGQEPDYTLVDMGGGFGGMTGDGVLDGTRGTIEHIAFVNQPADPLAMMSIWIDDLQTEAPRSRSRSSSPRCRGRSSRTTSRSQ